MSKGDFELALRGLLGSSAPLSQLVADGIPALWSALARVWPEAAEQRRWNHKILNVLDQLPLRPQGMVRGPPRRDARRGRAPAGRVREDLGAARTPREVTAGAVPFRTVPKSLKLLRTIGVGGS